MATSVTYDVSCWARF